MRLEEVRGEARLHELRNSWNAVLSQSASDTIFLTWEWITAWWQAYGNPEDLRILAAWDEREVLRGLAPLRSQSERRYGQVVSTLRFIGDGSFDSDYLDFIAARGYEERVFECFRSHWAWELREGTVIALNEVPDSSCFLPMLKGLSAAGETSWKDSDVPCAIVRLPGSWQAYLGRLKPRFRTKIRSVLQNMEHRPEVRFGCCRTREDVHRLLPVLFDLHQRRWATDGEPGVFRCEKKRAFYVALSDLLLDRESLSFTWLEFNGNVLACQYGFLYQGTYYHLQEGYEPEAEHWNVGIALRAWGMREFIGQGVREYDFLGGVSRHKSDWGAEVKHSKRIELVPRNRHTLLWTSVARCESRARSAVKALIPPAVLARRKARMERRQTASNRGPGQSAAFQVASTAAANAYYYLGLPAVTRGLYSSYEWCPEGFRKRRQASGRVFCYHRVNDRNDPFLPATPTGVFEEEIRYVARHHRVVSLTEMLHRLEDGPAEPVIAVTFDDGYRDNFENAFPILERYGVPATIFLATGIIDSGESLWFERLAESFKRTDRDFIDIEFGIPRRFWLRTESERLDSNRSVLDLLRKLPDSERRCKLDDLLKVMPVECPPERFEMLTWDQIRRMKACGIDFGGHTVTHPYLSRVPAEAARWEVAECKRRIEEETQAAVHYFAYPNGQPDDVGLEHAEMLHCVGYRAAMTTLWGLNYHSTDRMRLRRGGPWERHPAMFASKLDWYQFRNL
jgi:peptidoglycan/xylan/chitin deacetylase (PgdA/CDA1 family)/CelD/BcsL family acetyltransferase involved in cellulose biosynthesis